MDDLTSKVILFFITSGGFTITAFLFKKWIGNLEKKQTEMNGSVKDIIERHHNCKETLPNRFADKIKVEETFTRLFEKVDTVAVDIAFIKGKVARQRKK